VVLVFKPQSYTEVPDDLANFVEEGLNTRGVFKAPLGMSEEAFDAEKRKALLAYLGITLRERIVNFYAYQDDLRKKGATITADPRFDRALRWEKELRQVLSAEAPIEEELSFLETKRVENTESKEEELEEVEASFTEPKRKRGRPAANSSMEASA